MQNPAAYNLAPAGSILFMGLILALLPAWWVLKREPTAAGRYRALAVLTLFLTFDLVVFGAFTRLSDSGLGCPDWPGCYGESTPLAAHADISSAQSAMPTGPVTHGKAWIEMVHRYLATAVGALITLLAAMHAWLRKRRAPGIAASWVPVLTFVWVCMQGAFGALTVTMKLFPLIVTLHLLGGLGLLALLAVQARGSVAGVGRERTTRSGKPLPRTWLMVGLAVVVAQAALGAWVSSNYAVLACNTFPLCQGQIWPMMNFAAGFSLWRELGQVAGGGMLPFEALTAIHMVHRIFALLVLVVIGFVIQRLWRVGAQKSAKWLGALLGLQLLTGLSNVILDWPLVAALLHTGGAGALVVVLTSLLAEEVAA